MPATLHLRRWLRHRVVRPLDRWLTPTSPPKKYPLASRQDPCDIHQRLLKRLGQEMTPAKSNKEKS